MLAFKQSLELFTLGHIFLPAPHGIPQPQFLPTFHTVVFSFVLTEEGANKREFQCVCFRSKYDMMA